MRRGDLVTVALSGDFGKPRPAVVVQSDLFSETATVTLALVAGTRVDSPLLRLDGEPHETTGLRKPSQIMIDKIVTVRRERVGAAIGRLDDARLVEVNRALALFLGIA